MYHQYVNPFFFYYTIKKLRKWYLQTLWVLYICVCSHTHTVTIGKILILNSPNIVCLHAQSLGNIILSCCPCSFHITHFHKIAPNCICPCMRMHFFTVSFSADYTNSEQQLLSIFIWRGAGHTLYWHKCLVFTASVTTDSTFR